MIMNDLGRRWESFLSMSASCGGSSAEGELYEYAISAWAVGGKVANIAEAYLCDGAVGMTGKMMFKKQ